MYLDEEVQAFVLAIAEKHGTNLSAVNQLLRSNMELTDAMKRGSTQAAAEHEATEPSGDDMGADAFIAFFGLRYEVPVDDVEAVEAIETDRDWRVIAARRAKLQAYFGRLTDGEPHFLLVGTRLGVFGVENDVQRTFDAESLERLMHVTRHKLRDAGLTGEPQLHLQLEAQD